MAAPNASAAPLRRALVIGCGIAGLTCAIELAKRGIGVTLAFPQPPERAQSVMAAGGINAVMPACEEGDSVELHIEETLKGGCDIAGRRAVTALCQDAPRIVEWLERLGVVFTRDGRGAIAQRAFGGQSHRRTAYAGASTGKQVVAALVHEARRWECAGMIERRPWLRFHSALVRDGVVYGALFYSERDRRMEAVFADAVVVATGGQNRLFGKTTGSVLSDGYAAGRLFLQGVLLKNLEFIQYHPTTIETAHKRMLVTEGARGDGGRLYYLDGDKRVYFMEDRYGPRGNLMPRDVVAACIHEAPSQVYLDISFLGERAIRDNLGEVFDVCRDYLGIDVTRESIPVAPSVHFFMGGIAVDVRHRTNLGNLYAVGECASIYHGANRLGGNSLLAALHGGRVAAASIDYEVSPRTAPDFSAALADAQASLDARLASESRFSAVYLHNDLAQTMHESLGIVRDAARLEAGVASVDYYLSICDKIRYDSSVSAYQGFSLPATMTLARAVLTSALSRRESRGAHRRSDFPERSDELARCSFIGYDGGAYTVSYGSEDDPCW